jgi:hypothetical protein
METPAPAAAQERALPEEMLYKNGKLAVGFRPAASHDRATESGGPACCQSKFGLLPADDRATESGGPDYCQSMIGLLKVGGRIAASRSSAYCQSDEK